MVAAVPWARHGAGHTRAFDDQVAWLATHTSKTAVVELMRIAWRTVGAIAGRVVVDARTVRDDGLERFGIDEISYRSGHKYLVVVDHDSGRLVWAKAGHDRATLQEFFDLLGTERASRIMLVSSDAAEWMPRARPLEVDMPTGAERRLIRHPCWDCDHHDDNTDVMNPSLTEGDRHVGSTRGSRTPIHVETVRREAFGHLLLTHGLGDSSETWAAQLPELVAAGWSTTVWDLPGHGRSGDVTGAVTRDDALATLAALTSSVTTVAKRRTVFIGHSFGGYLSLALAVREPIHVQGLVLISTGPGFRDVESRRRWNEYVSAPHQFSDNPAAATLAQQHDALVVDGIDAISAPALVIVGSRDVAYHPGARFLEAKLGATVVEVPGAGHHVHRSHADAVNQAVLMFLGTLP